jgi:hypothetical protein
MSRDKVLAVAFELESLAVVLTNEVAYPCLCEPNPGAKLRCEIPFELFGDCVNGFYYL